MRILHKTAIIVLLRPHLLLLLLLPTLSAAFCIPKPISYHRLKILVRAAPSENSDWQESEDTWRISGTDGADDAHPKNDWQAQLEAKQDGSFWSSFEPSDGNGETSKVVDTSSNSAVDDEALADSWLDTLQSLAGEETDFIVTEAERADKARQMQEWQFPSEVIASTLGIAIDSALEKEEMEGMDKYRQESFVEEIDLETVESHTMVDRDPETGEPIRNQMVYVDEHTCIGCTNCAMIAQSTFFMNQEHGRARVFEQWGDDEETIQVAIETCPVDCIHYIPYDELVRLEVERREQNLNPKARLVSQGESGSTPSHRVGGAVKFTAAQRISGNMAPRCNNCPSKGCKNCPMYGVGMNPEFVAREEKRKERLAKRRLQEQRESQQKSAEL